MSNPHPPNIDWSGYAAPPDCKKHLPHPTSKISGGVGVDDTAEWKPGRKVSTEQSSNSSTSILGGPVPEKDPSVVSSAAWQSEAQAAQQKTKTSQEQLTESGRSRFVRGKQTTIPQYELAKPFDESVAARLRLENPYSLNDKLSSDIMKNEENGNPNTAETVDPNYSLVGYRSGAGCRSYLDGLGTEVAASATFAKKDDEEE